MHAQAVEQLETLCGQAEQLHGDIRQCLEIPMEEFQEDRPHLNVPAVRAAFDAARDAIDAAVRSVGEETDAGVTQVRDVVWCGAMQ